MHYLGGGGGLGEKEGEEEGWRGRRREEGV